MIKLGINIDHVATLRNARGGCMPSLIEAALVAESNGADSITVHLREDRRHIKDNDLLLIKATQKTVMNLELAVTDEMLNIAKNIKPKYVCLVPEKRTELTTEGGLNLFNNTNEIRNFISEVQNIGIMVSLFIDPDLAQVKQAALLKANSIELHTGAYCEGFFDDEKKSYELSRLVDAATLAHSLGLVVNAGHGLNYHNVTEILQVPYLNELNIGHAIIAQSIFDGLGASVAKMKSLINQAN